MKTTIGIDVTDAGTIPVRLGRNTGAYLRSMEVAAAHLIHTDQDTRLVFTDADKDEWRLTAAQVLELTQKTYEAYSGTPA